MEETLASALLNLPILTLQSMRFFDLIIASTLWLVRSVSIPVKLLQKTVSRTYSPIPSRCEPLSEETLKNLACHSQNVSKLLANIKESLVMVNVYFVFFLLLVDTYGDIFFSKRYTIAKHTKNGLLLFIFQIWVFVFIGKKINFFFNSQFRVLKILLSTLLFWGKIVEHSYVFNNI